MDQHKSIKPWFLSFQHQYLQYTEPSNITLFCTTICLSLLDIRILLFQSIKMLTHNLNRFIFTFVILVIVVAVTTFYLIRNIPFAYIIIIICSSLSWWIRISKIHSHLNDDHYLYLYPLSLHLIVVFSLLFLFLFRFVFGLPLFLSLNPVLSLFFISSSLSFSFLS